LKRCLQVLVAESEQARFLRDMISPRRRVRHAATEQECLDLGYAGAGDVMLVDIDDPRFSDPDFVSRVRFVSRSAFPILGVTGRPNGEIERWVKCGLAEVLQRETLTPYLLDLKLRHWVKHNRLQLRLYDANRRALKWWKDLVSALDEVRGRLEKTSDGLEAYLSLLESGDGEEASFRRSTVSQARKQVAAISQLATELDVAARTIQLEGIERSRTQKGRTDRPIFTEDSLAESAQGDENRNQLDPPTARSPHHQRRTGT
jgi:hypothetical protein